MAERPNDEKLLEIEQNQAALRKSIEKTKELAADSDRLIRRHRHEPKPPNPADQGGVPAQRRALPRDNGRITRSSTIRAARRPICSPASFEKR